MSGKSDDVFRFMENPTFYTVISPGTGEIVVNEQVLPGAAHVGLMVSTDLANQNTGDTCWLENNGPFPAPLDDGLLLF